MRAGRRRGRGLLIEALTRQPKRPLVALLRNARLRGLRRRLALTREVLDGVRDQFEEFEGVVESALGDDLEEEGVSDDYGTAGEFEETLAEIQDGAEGKARRGSARVSTNNVFERESSKSVSIDERSKLLNQIFERLEGKESAYTREGKPKVDEINTILDFFGQPVASRQEIDDAYEEFSGR